MKPLFPEELTFVSGVERNSEKELVKMQCPKCHKLLPDNINYCPYCGVNVYSPSSTDQTDYPIIFIVIILVYFICLLMGYR